jgi:hypothetical protein
VEGLAMEDVGIVLLVYIYVGMYLYMSIWNILWPFGKFSGYLVYLFPYWYVATLTGVENFLKAVTHL